MRTVSFAVLLVVAVFFPLSGLAADVPGSLKVDRIMLYFENQRAETTVERAGQKIRAYVDLRYSGSGLLEGSWEVDGRLLSRVSQHIRGGSRSITLQVPKSPGIPTMDPGTHILRFVLTNPAPELPVPSILYFVVPKDAQKGRITIRPVSPGDGTELDYGPATFSWEHVPDVDIYLIAFFEKPGAKPVFSAYSSGAAFELAEPALKSTFVAGRKYFWKVTGYDVEKNLVGEHKGQGFSFRK